MAVSTLTTRLLTVEGIYALRRSTYEVPDRLVRMLDRLVTSAPVRAAPAHAASGGAGGWTTVGSGSSSGRGRGGGGFHGFRGGRGGGRGGGYQGRGNWDPAPEPMVRKRVKLSDNATLDKAMGILNKISAGNYDKLKGDLAGILEEFPDDVILMSGMSQRLFEMASLSPLLTPIYARLVLDLDNQLVMTTLTSKYAQFMNSFEKPIESININNKHEDIEDAVERAAAVQKDYDLWCAQNKVKRERRGFAQWIGELYKIKVLNAEDVAKVVQGLGRMMRADADKAHMADNNHEYAECLHSLAKALKGTPAAASIVIECRQAAAVPKADTPGLSMRTRFKLQDITEGRGL